MRDELNTYHRRSSHAGSSSLDSSSIYALLSFDSSPENGCADCIDRDADSFTAPVSRLRPVYCKDGISVRESVKYQRRRESSNKADRTSVTSFVSAVPNQYIDSVSSAIEKKQLVVSLCDADASKCTQPKASENNSVHFSVKDKLSVRNGLMSLLSADGDNTVVPASSDKMSLRNDAAAEADQCPEINYRRYSCGDQFAATWWRLLDRAASFSDLRVLPRSLSRFCCSTWRTFTGVKSPCIDVSKVGNVVPAQPSEASRLNINGVNISVGDEIIGQSAIPWWHKPVSPDRRRLIEIGSDVESSSACDDSPRKVDCHRVLLGSPQSVRETAADGQLSDSDGGGSYVSLRVHSKSSSVPHSTLCDENVPHRCHTDCDISDEDDTVLSVSELPTTCAVNGQDRAQKQTGDIQYLSVAKCGPSVQVSQTSPSRMCSCVAVQPSLFSPASMSCQSSVHSVSSGSCSLSRSDQLLQSNNGYINLSLGVQSSSLGNQSATCLLNSSSCNNGQPAEISTETKSVPNLRSGPTVQADNNVCSADKERLSCDNNEPLMDKLSRKSSNRLLRLIRRSSTKTYKQPSTYSAAAAAECNVHSGGSPAVSSTDTLVSSSTGGNDQPPIAHRLPSPDVPPPPVPDDSATSRLFHLCHASFSEHSRINPSIDCDSLSHYEDLSFVKSCAAASRNAAFSSSHSAGDKRHSDGQSLKSSLNDDNVRLLSRMPSQRQGHGLLLYLDFYCISNLIHVIDVLTEYNIRISLNDVVLQNVSISRKPVCDFLLVLIELFP